MTTKEQVCEVARTCGRFESDECVFVSRESGIIYWVNDEDVCLTYPGVVDRRWLKTEMTYAEFLGKCQ